MLYVFVLELKKGYHNFYLFLAHTLIILLLIFTAHVFISFTIPSVGNASKLIISLYMLRWQHMAYLFRKKCKQFLSLMCVLLKSVKVSNLMSPTTKFFLVYGLFIAIVPFRVFYPAAPVGILVQMKFILFRLSIQIRKKNQFEKH